MTFDPKSIEVRPITDADIERAEFAQQRIKNDANARYEKWLFKFLMESNQAAEGTNDE